MANADEQVQYIKPLELAPKQIEALELCRRKKYNLLSGPRRSSKTVGGLACLCDHAWRTPHGEVSLVAVSQSSGLQSGVWDQLVDGILPQYMALGYGMKWVRKPFTAQSSKRPTCIVSNAYGGTCRFQLESLKDESEVEPRFKNKNYTAMFVTELSHFKNPKTFSIWKQCLRSIHGLKPNQFLFLGDTNPSDEGDSSWIYHQWFIRPKQEYGEYCIFQAERGLPISSEEDFRQVNEQLGLLEFEIADNVFLTEQDIRELIDDYSHDKDLYDRYILGKWVKASTGAIFARNFRENVHTGGELETPGNPDPLILVPQPSTWELFVSIDPGTSANSAGYIGEKFTPLHADGTLAPAMFTALDEVAIIGEDHSLADFVMKLLEKMDWWEEFMGRKFQWHSWSDRSVFEQKDNSTGKLYHQIIYEVSKGRLAVQAADRSKGSVGQRIDLQRRLLFENRILVSRRCPRLVQMYKSMPASKKNPDEPAKGTPHKHCSDAWGYGLASESLDEVATAVMNTIRKNRQSTASGLVSIAA